MDNNPTLNSLLMEYHLKFIWDKKIKYWWLEGTDFSNHQWQSPIFHAPSEEAAQQSAIEYIQFKAVDFTENRGSR